MIIYVQWTIKYLLFITALLYILKFYMSSKSRQKLFQIDEEKIQYLLFCDNSDTEDAIELDEEDIGFLKKDLDHIAENVKVANFEPVEVVIDPPIQSSNANTSTASSLQANEQKSMSSEEVKYRWKKVEPGLEVSNAISNNSIDFDYGQILLPLETTATPFEVFRKVSKFDQLLQD